MGGKRSGKRKHLHLLVAGLILLLSGCTLVSELKEQLAARDTLTLSQRLLAQGDYEGALRENQRILSNFEDRSLRDEALFHMGLIYSHTENPNRDYHKAMDLFQKVMEDYPQSPLAHQAKAWLGVIQTNDKLIQANEKLTQANDKLTRANEKLTQTNEKLTQTNEKLNLLIEKSKQVDLEIEEKKRKK